MISTEEFRKQRIKRLIKNYASIMARVLEIKDENMQRSLQHMLRDTIDSALETSKALPNSQKKPNFNKSLPKPDLCDVYHYKEWQECCAAGTFIDYDGFGHPAKAVGAAILMDETIILKPSEAHDLPEGTESVVWFNR